MTAPGETTAPREMTRGQARREIFPPPARPVRTSSLPPLLFLSSCCFPLFPLFPLFLSSLSLAPVPSKRGTRRGGRTPLSQGSMEDWVQARLADLGAAGLLRDPADSELHLGAAPAGGDWLD